MKKIIGFAGSNHSASINQQLVQIGAKQLTEVEVEVIDLRDYAMPMYSQDLEKESGFPDGVTALQAKLDEADGYLIASPEHNGMVPAFFKNAIDWLSRNNRTFLGSKPVVLLSTSPGAKGGATNLANLAHVLPYFGAKIVSSFSLPSFYEKAAEGNITDAELAAELTKVVQSLEKAVNTSETES